MEQTFEQMIETFLARFVKDADSKLARVQLKIIANKAQIETLEELRSDEEI